MKHLALCLTTVALAAGAARAQQFNFDSLPGGATGDPAVANSYSQGGITFQPAVFGPDINPSTGEAVPNSSKWRRDTDPLTPAVSAENPLLYGRGTAPSGTRALNALLQPVLVTFSQSANLSYFETTLDFSSKSGNAGSIQSVLYLGASGQVLDSQAIDLSLPGQHITHGPLSGVSAVLLPGGKFYDNFSIVGVPEPSTVALSVFGGALLLAARRKRA